MQLLLFLCILNRDLWVVVLHSSIRLGKIFQNEKTDFYYRAGYSADEDIRNGLTSIEWHTSDNIVSEVCRRVA